MGDGIRIGVTGSCWYPFELVRISEPTAVPVLVGLVSSVVGRCGIYWGKPFQFRLFPVICSGLSVASSGRVPLGVRDVEGIVRSPSLVVLKNFNKEQISSWISAALLLSD
jgi:hypothetical protein